MADQRNSSADPFTSWREWLSDSERQWNNFFNEVMGTEEFSQFVGRFTGAFLAMHKSMADTVGRCLGSMNLPTRDDVLNLGHRLAVIEDRLATLEASLRQSLKGLGPAGGSSEPPPRPPRTKRPAGGQS